MYTYGAQVILNAFMPYSRVQTRLMVPTEGFYRIGQS
jgi:hypothetical protein